MKRIISVMLILLLSMGLTAFADQPVIGGSDAPTDILVTDSTPKNADIPIKIIADNKIVETETVVVNERTLIPLRALLESTGADVKWIGETQSVEITRLGKTITISIGSTVMKTPDGEKALEVSPILHEGTTTYAPLRAIAEEFGITVDWDGGTRTILVLTPDGERYVDLYNGMTLGEYLEMAGVTPGEYELQTTLSYEKYKDELFTTVDNLVPVSAIAALNSMTVEELFLLFHIDTEPTEQMTWGEFLDRTTLGVYADIILGASQFGLNLNDALSQVRQRYGLGEEYTIETKFRYARVIMHTKEAQYMAEQEAIAKQEEAKKLEDERLLPSLTKNKVRFTITLANGSVMKGELYPDLAPKTVANFVKLANTKFYDGLIFHRVIDGFMIQGGGYGPDYKEKEGAQAIEGEFYANGFTNALKHEKGVISMARTDDPNSATSQFFIVDETSAHLDGYYAAFGKITSGLDVLDKLSSAETHTNEQGFSDSPVKPIVIRSIRINN